MGSLGAAMGDAAGAIRRARESRQARVRVYDGDGAVRTLRPESEAGRALLEAAEALLDVVDAPRSDPPSDGPEGST